ncbi:PTS cellobiose IIC subunit [Mesoplasma florum]|uniref:PTS transporter subunit EIIC n=1 Tax=Mesoplasma florum TaxID=2151 RepID=UPI000D03D62F|nr:PTS transporter subunit EIIC [Mesoplasma florum]AVN63658.1 PTS cellobiose IIC subunit [Mesoplasma florum]
MQQNVKLKNWFNTKMIPAVTKLGSQRHLASLRDAFGTLIPLTIAGSLGLIMSGIVFGGGGSGYVSLLGLICKMAHPEMEWSEISNYFWQDNGFNKAMLIGSSIFSQLNTITIGMTSLWFAFTFGYFLGISRNFKNPVIAGFASLIGFLATTMGQVSFFQGAEGLISALIFGIISTELFMYLCNVRALYIKMPDGVPPSVSKSFAVFLPFMITVGLIALSNIVFVAPAIFGANLAVTKSMFTNLSTTTLADFIQKYSVDGSVQEALNKIFTENNSADLISQLQAIFTNNVGNSEGFMKELEAFYNGLNQIDKSTVSTMIAVLNGVGSSTINNLYGAAELQFIDSNGVQVLMSKYIGISISGASFGWSAAIYQFFVSGLLIFATGNGGLALALAYAFFISFLWFFGVHGSNIVNGAFSPIWSMIGTINLTLITALGYSTAVATGEMGVFSGQFFDTFMNLGGSGATISLVFATLIFSRKQELKKIATYAAPSGIFQINEPVLFGFPIVLNPFYVIPFVLNPMLNVIIGWIFSPDVLNVYGYAQVSVPWTTPYFIAAVIVYMSPKALIPVLFVTATSFLIYVPFVLLDNMMYFKKLKNTNIEEYNKEMKFYNDPQYKFEVKTDNKYENMVNKSEVVVNNAYSQVRFWETKMTNKDKFELRKERLLKAGTLKQEFYLMKANEFKNIRIMTEEVYNEKWEAKKVINYLKLELNEKSKLLDNKEAKTKLKEEYAIKISVLKDKEKINKEQMNSKIAKGKEKIKLAKVKSKEKIKLEKSILETKLKELK